MSDMFLKVLNMSIAASWLILALFLTRLLLKKAPKWILCLLWGLVALRLVCPFSLESALSLIPSVQTIPANIALQSRPAINSGIPIINEAVNPLITDALAPEPFHSANPLQILIPLAALVWIAGIGIMLIYALISYLKLRKAVAPSLPVDKGIFACDEVKSPFILGLFRPGIYVPSSMNEETLNHVILHEKAHLQRHDHWWKPLGFLLLAVYWFNPLCWIAYILLCRDIEMACDERVIRDMGPTDIAAYSQALLDCSCPKRRITACPLAFGEAGVKVRIKGLLNYKKPAFWIIGTSILVGIALAVFLMTDPPLPAEEKQAEEAPVEKKPEETPASVEETPSEAISSENTIPNASLEIKTAVAYVNHVELFETYLSTVTALNPSSLALSFAIHLPVCKLDSPEDLEQFRESFRGIIHFDQGYNEMPSFDEVTGRYTGSRYDEDFFQSHSLLLAYYSAGSGSFRYAVRDFQIYGSRLCMNVIQTNHPEVYTSDMAGWLFLAEVPDEILATVTEFDAVMDGPTNTPMDGILDFASFDIDMDGVVEDCTLSHCPISALITMVITASVDGEIKYKNTFTFSEGVHFTEIDGSTQLLLGDVAHKLYVEGERIVIEGLDPECGRYWGGPDWNFGLD